MFDGQWFKLDYATGLAEMKIVGNKPPFLVWPPSFSPLLAKSVLVTLSTRTLWAQNAGTETSLEFAAPWPPWVTILVVTLAAVFTLGLYFREQTSARGWIKFGMACLRFMLMCIVLWMMYGYAAQPFRTDLPDLLLVVDTSASMRTEDADLSEAIRSELGTANLKTTSRLSQAKHLLLREDAKLLEFLQQNYQAKLVTLDSSSPNAPSSANGADKKNDVSDPTNEAKTQDVSPDLATQISSLRADAPSSQLGGRLRKALQQQRGRPVAAVVYLTDGITTDGPPLSEIGLEAKQRTAPLHVIALGSQVPQQDIRLSDLLYDELVFKNDYVTFDLSVSANGYKDQTVDVTLQATSESRDVHFDVQTKQVTFRSDEDAQPIRLIVKAEHVGKFEFVVETRVHDGEVSGDNNQLRANVEVIDEQTRLLLVQAYPSYEYHYLKTLFDRGASDRELIGNDLAVEDVAAASDSNAAKPPVQLDVILQEADPEFSDIDGSVLANFPNRQELFNYDIVIIGDANPTYLGDEALANLRDFVRELGRGMVVIAGPRYMPSAYADTPLAEVLPFEVRDAFAPPADLPIESGFRPQLTPLGRRMPSLQLSLQPDENNWIWSQLPELYWLLEVDALKPGVRVLTEHTTRTNGTGRPLPVTTLSYVGAGKVLFHNTDDSWRWRIGRGDQYFARYWQQTLRYLSRFKLGEGRDVELTTDRDQYKRGDLVRLRARYYDERKAPSDRAIVWLEQQGRNRRRVVLRRDESQRGIFTADLPNLGVGSYHGWISQPVIAGEAPATDFEVTASNTELTRLVMDAADMQRAAEVSGGEYYTFDMANELIGNLPIGRQVRIEPLPPEPLWNSWKIAAAFLFLLLAEWLGRRRLGMV